MAGADSLIFFGFYLLLIPFVIVLSEGFTLRYLGWQPSPFKTALAMFFASVIAAFTLLYGGTVLARASFGRKAEGIIFLLYPLTFTISFILDGLIMMSIGESDHGSKRIWQIVALTNVIGCVTVLIVWRLFEITANYFF